MILSLLMSGLTLLGGAYAEIDGSGMMPIATCDMRPNPRLAKNDPLYEDIYGMVYFSESADGEWVELRINLQGFNTTDAGRSHGFHIHTGSDITEQCEDSGPHFNPFLTRHGGPGKTERHVGDLGNLVEDDSGKVVRTMIDDVIKFRGMANVAGRTLDIHKTVDDLLPTGNGNDGPRIACCIVTLLPPDMITAAAPSANSVMTSSIVVTLGLLSLFL